MWGDSYHDLFMPWHRKQKFLLCGTLTSQCLKYFLFGLYTKTIFKARLSSTSFPPFSSTLAECWSSWRSSSTGLKEGKVGCTGGRYLIRIYYCSKPPLWFLLKSLVLKPVKIANTMTSLKCYRCFSCNIPRETTKNQQLKTQLTHL